MKIKMVPGFPIYKILESRVPTFVSIVRTWMLTDLFSWVFLSDRGYNLDEANVTRKDTLYLYATVFKYVNRRAITAIVPNDVIYFTI